MTDELPGKDARLALVLEELEVARFVARAGAALAQVADYESTLERIANLAVPAFADWFGVLVREDDGSVRRIVMKHRDPAKERAINELYQRYPPDGPQAYGPRQVLRTGKAMFVPDVSSVVGTVARDPEHERMIRAFGLRSFLCVPMRSQGKVSGTLTFATAESGRIYSEMHLRAAEDLAARCAVAIENAHLLGALREADRRKDEFLAVLAHELRNPLAPLRNAVEILRARSGATDETRWVNDVIDRQVRQMSRLVDDLLDVSRIASGKIELRRTRFPLSQAVDAAVEASRPAIERGGHELSVVIAEPIELEADVVRISQVLSNLLTNAAKYTPGPGRITLMAAREGGEAVIRVLDTGAGIPHEMLDKVFDMFVQVPRSGDAAQGGLGIGLTLVKRLVEMHGGTVEAKSAGVGLGSEFVVRLPAVARDAEDEARAKAASGKYVRMGLSRRILVVDDNRDAADSLAVLLKAHGHDVRVAYDGVEAMGAVYTFAPDTVLLDVGLPRIDGLDVARRIRQVRGPDVLLIAVTGFGQEADRQRSLAAGFDHHLTKPVEFERLHQLLVSAAPASVRS